jgi:hypothetical protein
MEFDPTNIVRYPINTDEINVIDKFFDENGKKLYDELRNEYSFSFFYYNQKSIVVNVRDKFADFLIPENSHINKALFTHELLHFSLLSYGINNRQALLDSTVKQKLHEVLNISEDNLMYIHNFLDHIIIYNDFKDMGYKDNEFVIDYCENKFNKDIESFLWYKFENNVPDDYAISYYISKYIGLRSPVNYIRDYSKAYKKMRGWSPKLYNICKIFIDEYQSIANEDYESIYQKYESVINNFVRNLKNTLL